MKNNDIHDYTDLSNDYDETRYITDFQIYLDTLRFKAFDYLLVPKKNMKILDVGTGTGSGVLYFASLVDKIVGLDATESMLNLAKEKTRAKGIVNAEFVLANALEIPYENETFDHVISLNFIHLFAGNDLSKQISFISEMERVCKRGGKVIVEFDNNLYQKKLGNYFGDLFKMSNTMLVKKVIGTYMPKMQPVYNINKGISGIYSKLSWLPILNRFAYRWAVLYLKQ